MSKRHVQFLDERLQVYLSFRLFRNELRQRFANFYTCMYCNKWKPYVRKKQIKHQEKQINKFLKSYQIDKQTQDKSKTKQKLISLLFPIKCA